MPSGHDKGRVLVIDMVGMSHTSSARNHLIFKIELMKDSPDSRTPDMLYHSVIA